MFVFRFPAFVLLARLRFSLFPTTLTSISLTTLASHSSLLNISLLRSSRSRSRSRIPLALAFPSLSLTLTLPDPHSLATSRSAPGKNLNPMGAFFACQDNLLPQIPDSRTDRMKIQCLTDAPESMLFLRASGCQPGIWFTLQPLTRRTKPVNEAALQCEI